MNEQIKQLWEQAANTTHGDSWEEQTKFIERFAELIVQECIGIVEPTSHHEAFAQGYMGGVDGLDLLYGKVKQIKKHFGVEE
jgi:hypothetical protein